MFGLLLPLLALSKIDYPKFYVIYADTTFDSTSISLFEQLYKDFLNQYKNACGTLTGEDKEMCLAYVNAFAGVKAVNSKDINSALMKVPSNNEFLLIVGDTMTTTMNFAYLPKQMLVFLYGNSAVPNSQSAKNLVEDIADKFKQASLDKSKNGVFRLAKAFKPNKKSVKADALPVFPIIGNIKSRVSFLTVIGAELRITVSALNCHSLFLSYGSKFSSSSLKCSTTFFIADELSQLNVQGKNFVNSEQYGIFLDEYNYTQEHFLISYETNSWKVYSTDDLTQSFKYMNYYVPYSTCKAFNLIVESYDFYIHLQDSTITNPKQVNITVTGTITMALLPELLANPVVKVSSQGSWEKIKNLPIEVITTDCDLQVSSRFKLKYKKYALFDYSNPTSEPLPYEPTPVATATPSPMDYPEFYVIYADTTFDSSSIPLFEQLYTNFINQYKNVCDTLTGEERDFCLAYVNAFKGVKAVNSKDINSALSKVPSNNEFLIIVGDTLTTTINFAYLPKQMLVFLYGNSAVPNSESARNLVEDIADKFKQASLDKSKNGVFRLAKALESDKKSTKASLATFPVSGGIKSRVSYLTVIGAELKILDNALNCHSLYLSGGSKFASGSLKCSTTFFIADESSHKNIAGTTLVTSEQYGIHLNGQEDYTGTYFLVSYEKDRWRIYSNDGTSSTYKYTNLEVPYSTYKAFNVIALSFHFDFHLNYNGLTDARPVNVTVTETVTMVALPELLAEEKVKITSSGKWQTVASKPTEVITSDFPVEIDQYYQLSYKVYGVYDYFSPSIAPLPYQPTPAPTATPYKPTPNAMNYPKFYVIYADTTFDSTSISLFEQLYKDYLSHFKDACDALSGEERDFCAAYVNAFLGVKAVNSKDINSAFSKVPSNNEFLLIVGDTLSTTMNFAYLPKQMLVFLYGNSAVPNSQSAKNLVEDIADKFKQASLDKSKNGVFSLAKAFKAGKKLEKRSGKKLIKEDENLPVFPLYGNIKSRVSFLTVIGAELKIVSNNLNCHTLFLSEGSRFAAGSLKCATNFFIADETSQLYIDDTKIVLSEQYGIFFDAYDYTEDSFQISYKKDRWAIYTKDSSMKAYEYTGLYLNYSTYYKAFNLIVDSYKFDFNLDYNYLVNARPVNITVTETINMAQLPELLAEQKVYVSSSGNWQTVAAKPVQVISTDYKVDIDPYYQLSYKTFGIFDYFSPSSAQLPYQPTPPPSATPYKPTPYPIDYPEFYVIYADNTFDSTSIPAFEQLYNDYLKNFGEACGVLEGDDKEFCLAYVKAFLGVKAVNSKDINSALSKVPSNNEFLIIVGDTLTTTINFAYLPKQMLVFLYGNSAVPNSESAKNLVQDIGERFKQASLNRKKNGVFRLAKAFKSGKKSDRKAVRKAVKESLPQFPIYGNIKSRVSFLTVVGAELKIVSGSVLNCHSLFLSEGSRFASGSLGVSTTFFIADESSQVNVQGSKLIACEQYGLFFDEYDYSGDYFQISYKSDRWAINIKDYTTTSYEYSYVYVPYSSYKALNLITDAYNFDIHLDYDYLVDPKQVNITVTDTINMAQLPELLAEQKVRVTSSGNWHTVENKPIEVITADHPIEIDPYYQPQFATYGIFDYLNPSSVPLPAKSTPPPPPSNTEGNKSGGSSFGPGKIAGTTVGAAAGVGAIATAAACLGKKKDDDEGGGGNRSSELFDNMNP